MYSSDKLRKAKMQNSEKLLNIQSFPISSSHTHTHTLYAFGQFFKVICFTPLASAELVWFYSIFNVLHVIHTFLLSRFVDVQIWILIITHKKTLVSHIDTYTLFYSPIDCFEHPKNREWEILNEIYDNLWREWQSISSFLNSLVDFSCLFMADHNGVKSTCKSFYYQASTTHTQLWEKW